MKNKYDYELMLSNVLLKFFKIVFLLVLNAAPILLMFIPYNDFTIMYYLLGVFGFFFTIICMTLCLVDLRDKELTTLPFWQAVNWILLPYMLWNHLKKIFLDSREKYKL